MWLSEIIEAYEVGVMSADEALELSSCVTLLDIYQTEEDLRLILTWAGCRVSANDNRRR